jgi:hypothetical protein
LEVVWQEFNQLFWEGKKCFRLSWGGHLSKGGGEGQRQPLETLKVSQTWSQWRLLNLQLQRQRCRGLERFS